MTEQMTVERNLRGLCAHAGCDRPATAQEFRFGVDPQRIPAYEVVARFCLEHSMPMNRGLYEHLSVG
jgi:hypothetical protein